MNGSVTLTLPADAAFDLKASSINGGIRSTFPLPVSGAASGDEDVARAAEDVARAEADRARAEAERARAKAERSRGGTKGEDDEWDREWEEFGREMASFGREMARFGREISRSVNGSLNRSYEGAVKGGGASVRCSTVNGGVVVLAAGTTESAATSLVPKKSAKWAVAPVPPVPRFPRCRPFPRFRPFRLRSREGPRRGVDREGRRGGRFQRHAPDRRREARERLGAASPCGRAPATCGSRRPERGPTSPARAET